MERIAKFSLVSFDEFKKGFIKNFGERSDEDIREIYDGIVLPTRATYGSAGYDFHSPVAFELKPNETVTVPTGVRARMNEGWVLTLYPRSGLGFKFRMQLNNTVGVIDSDYYYSDNEGHIFIKFTNATNENKTISVSKGDGIAQGIFLPFGITEDDNATEKRNGGFGSTGK